MEAIRNALLTALLVEERRRAAHHDRLVREANPISHRHRVAAQLGRFLIRTGTRLEALDDRRSSSVLVGPVDACYDGTN
jgi:hypothetical protein